MALVRAAAHSKDLREWIPTLPDSAAAIIQRHAPIATCINDFYVELHGERRDARYPRAEIEALLQAASIPPRQASAERHP